MSEARVLLPANATLTLQPDMRILLTVYQTIMIFTAILGNSVVVYATRKFNAIHLDCGSVLLVQNLALTDVALVVLAYVPKLITLLGGGWVLGHAACAITAFAQFAPGASEIMTLTSIAGYRCYMVRFPLKAHPSVSRTKALIGVIWGSAVLLPAVFICSNKTTAVFDVRTLGCVTNVATSHPTLTLIGLFVFGIVPVLLTITLNLYTLLLASWYLSPRKGSKTSLKKHASSHNRQALVSPALVFIYISAYIQHSPTHLTFLSIYWLLQCWSFQFNRLMIFI